MLSEEKSLSAHSVPSIHSRIAPSKDRVEGEYLIASCVILWRSSTVKSLIFSISREQLCVVLLSGVSVIANRYLLALAFRNLIENNCKYSSDHTSHVAIGVQQGLSIVFADKGIGMTPAERRNLFRMFYRGSNHAESGHGIGMPLVQRIMVLHNACIDVQSKEGHGTKFIISFTNNK